MGEKFGEKSKVEVLTVGCLRRGTLEPFSSESFSLESEEGSEEESSVRDDCRVALWGKERKGRNFS